VCFAARMQRIEGNCGSGDFPHPGE
jgi:hypothetical protein